MFHSNSRSVDTEYASPPSLAIERGCSFGANHAQNRRLTSSGPTTASQSHDLGSFEHVSTSALRKLFLKEILVLDIRDAPLPNADQRRLLRWPWKRPPCPTENYQ
ncbi:hypothetical protein FFI89_012215 [Bradyrhizobium sp. KBS0727]|uniref:hypothetical protein n=1 Tax=unclassified Bradyrhizobium TaxID=2631580 RepID=UPI00110EE9D6|nr:MULTISPECIES: hypothetical protein [unclassified Bradyrhizobium]QDW37849.1 hypothetical protein FFI71_012210 [Bradyrhizobium sp. KBS0725]QDW44453.1 hypothetical protein FFI89_012215 [Bradyrhizobium sp. KBS0727]